MRLPERTADEVRIGVAITVPEPYGAQLQEARARFGDPWAPYIPPHVTLLGPTVVARSQLAQVDEHLTRVAAAHRAFLMRLHSTGTFRPVSPVVFVQVAAGIADCEALEGAIRTDVLAQDLHFHYHPHVTVAHELPDDQLDVAFDQMIDFDAAFVVSQLHCYEHGDDGVWRTRRDFALRGASRTADAPQPSRPATR